MRPDLPESSYAVLGLIDRQPASGYDLGALAERSLANFWPISRTLVYRELARLESLGWAEATEVAQDRLPDKRVWSTTAEGRRALADWLIRPAEGGSFRSGFLLKFMFGGSMPPAVLASLLVDYRASLQATVAYLTAIVQQLQSTPAASMGRLAALHGLRSTEGKLAWLDEVEAELMLPSPAATEPAPGEAPEPRPSKARSAPVRTEPDAKPVSPRKRSSVARSSGVRR